MKKNITLCLLIVTLFVLQFYVAKAQTTSTSSDLAPSSTILKTGKTSWDGRLFVRLKPAAHLKIPDIDTDQKPLPASTVVPVLGNLVTKYGISKVFRPFTLTQNSNLLNTYEINFSKTDKIDALMRDLNAHPAVEFSEKVPIEETFYDPNDNYENQGYTSYLNKIQAYLAWDLTKGNTNVVVAVVDDAVRWEHEDLDNKYWKNSAETANGIDDDGNGYVDDLKGWDFADSDNNPTSPTTATASTFSHGTHIAGICAANTDNTIGVAGVGFNIKYMPLKCVKDNSATPNIITHGWNGVQYAIAKKADVISISWGGTVQSSTYQSIIDDAEAAGIVVVAAVGNDGQNMVYYPAGYTNVVAVAATSSSDVISSYSNYGTAVKICAPGNSIYSTVATTGNNGYASKSGTSMATPVVSGIVALIKSYNGSLSPAAIRSCLYSTADDISTLNPNYIGLLGAGRVNAQKAVQCALNNNFCAVPYSLSATNIASTTVTLNWQGSTSSTSYTFRIRKTGTTAWTELTTTATSYSYTGLTSCTPYEFQVKAKCTGNNYSDYSASYTFSTYNASPTGYCSQKGNIGDFEWISSVKIDNTTYTSSKDAGYGNYVCKEFAMTAGSTSSFSITPAYSGVAFQEHFSIWIDYNRDGDFSDAGEQAFVTPATTNTTVTGTINVPTTAVQGLTRMRVAMKWSQQGDMNPATLCTNFDYGEVEDYTISMISNGTQQACVPPTSLSVGNVTTNTANISWGAVNGANSYSLRYKINGAINWTTLSVTGSSYTISGLSSSTNYEVQIASVCTNNVISSYTTSSYFTTAAPACLTPTNITATNVTISTAYIAWTAAANAQSYTIYYKPVTSTTWQNITSVTNNTTLSNLTSNTNYEVQVKTVCSTNNSSNNSTSVTFTTPINCTAPTTLSTTNITATSAQINWGAVSSAANGYLFSWRVQNGVWSSDLATLNTNANLSNLTPSTTYEFRVKSQCSPNTTSAYSTSQTFTTLALSCNVVTNITAASITTSTAIISWVAAANAQSYTVYYKPVTSTTWQSISSTSNNATLSNLTSNTNYEVQVKTICGTNSSSNNSTSIAFTTLINCTAPTGLSTANITSTSAQISWISVGVAANGYAYSWRVQNAAWSADVTTLSTTATLNNLIANTTYEFRVKSQCSANTVSAYSLTQTFTTLPTPTCNTLPATSTVNNLTTTSGTISWSAVTGAASYQMRYKPTTATTWTTNTTTTTTYNITNLQACTAYEYQINVTCTNNITSSFSSSTNFSTPCDNPPPIMPPYCTVSPVPNASKEWIQSVVLHTINNNSGANGGYGDFTSTTVSLNKGVSYPFTLTPGYSGTQYKEGWTIFVDWNQDGDFADANEKAFDGGLAVNIPISNVLTIPSTANTGITRMRIAMKYSSALTAPCGGTNFAGEIEDYTVNVLEPPTAAPTTYCAVKASTSANEWIYQVQFNTINKISDNNFAQGYTNFTNISTSVVRGNTYTIKLTPAYSNTQYKEAWTVWIDYNKDGDFTDAGETVVTVSPGVIGQTTANITIPTTATIGYTRMRIAMKYSTATTTPCTNYNQGEVEDYTLNIAPSLQNTIEGEATAQAATVKLPVECDIKPAFNYAVKGLDVVFENLTKGTYDSYEWDFGDGDLSREENPRHTYQRQEKYDFTVTFIDTKKDCFLNYKAELYTFE